MAYLFTHPLNQYCDANGKPLAGGNMRFFNTGTAVVKNSYDDNALTVLNPVPLGLDSSGRPMFNAYMGTGAFDVEVYDSTNNLVAHANAINGELPPISSADNGYALGVVNGDWELIPVANGAASYVTYNTEPNLLNSKKLISADFTIAVAGADIGVNYPDAVGGGNLVTNAVISNSRELKQVIAAGTGAMTFDYALGAVIDMTQTGNISSVAFTNVPLSASGAVVVTMIRRVTTTTPFTITWGAAFKFPNGIAPSLGNSVSTVTVLSFLTTDGGVTWLSTYTSNI